MTDARRAQAAFAAGNDAGTAAPVEAGLTAVRALRAQLGSMGLSDAARYEIDFRLKIKERDYEDAVLAAHDLTFDALADDGLVIGGQPVRLTIMAGNRGAFGRGRDGGATLPVSTRRGTAQPGAVGKDAAFTCSRRRARAARREADHALLPRQLLEAPGQPGHPDFRPGRAVRRSVRAHAVPRDVPCEGGQRGCGARKCRWNSAM